MNENSSQETLGIDVKIVVVSDLKNSNDGNNSRKERETISVANNILENDLEENVMMDSEMNASVNFTAIAYAWIILTSIFVSTVLTQGYVHNFGIVTSAVMDFYPDSSGAMAGVILGLLSAARSVLAPFIGTLANKIGLRKSMCFGAFLYAAALFISFFCTSMAQLSVTLGVFIGLSHCILECSQITVLSQYFVKRLSFANGVRGAASPLGGMIYPFVLTVLLEHFGLRLTFLLLSAISCHTLTCAVFMRPLSIHLKIKALEKSRKILRKSENEEFMLKPIKGNGGTFENHFSHSNDEKKLYFQILKEYENLKLEKPKKKLEFKFFKNPIFLIFISISCVLPMAIPLVTYYTILYTKNYLRLSPYEVTVIVSFQAALDFCSRILIGYINNKNLWNKSINLMICLWISSVGTLLIPFGTNLTFLIISVGLFTIGPAAYTASIAVILCEEFGKENITCTWGFVKMVHGIFSFVHSLLIGYIVDSTGGYTIPFVIMGCGTALCGGLMGIEAFALKYFSKRTHNLNIS
ncbi:Monocarboxylate transporter 12-B [Armadillidium nasatum]|uniref:Monocarboxylate transporter 12-B n=1 Tax=Armadillidium nasatum TaxID=96803 RepID=A0A5N5SQI5_9CRUS|nr:Monocarboxylate transporter 12-B [Armadillidium nasatum]